MWCLFAYERRAFGSFQVSLYDINGFDSFLKKKKSVEKDPGGCRDLLSYVCVEICQSQKPIVSCDQRPRHVGDGGAR